jgi:hypothetical protein
MPNTPEVDRSLKIWESAMSNDDGDTVTNAGPEPTGKESIVGEFKIKVSLMGVEQGWFTDVGGPEYWIAVTPNKADAITWTQVTYGGHTYLKKSTNNYLSYRSNNVIFVNGMKIRAWATAAKWQLDGDFLKCIDNGNLAGRDGDKFYVNNQNIVKVEFIRGTPD